MSVAVTAFLLCEVLENRLSVLLRDDEPYGLCAVDVQVAGRCHVPMQWCPARPGEAKQLCPQVRRGPLLREEAVDVEGLALCVREVREYFLHELSEG